MRSLLIRCYPARWRARYGDEFEAILEERPLGPFDVTDILLGALDAQLRLRGQRATIEHGRASTMTLRIGGFAAILGSILWAAGAFLSLGMLVRVDGAVPPVLLLTGMALLLVALIFLSAIQARSHPRLAWAALALPAAGTVTVIVGFVATRLAGGRVAEPSWYPVVVGVGLLAALGGCLLFAIATYRMALLSRGGAVLLGVGSVVVLVQPLIAVGFPSILGLVQPLVAVGLACFTLGWSALGVQAIRLDRSATAPRPA